MPSALRFARESRFVPHQQTCPNQKTACVFWRSLAQAVRDFERDCRRDDSASILRAWTGTLNPSVGLLFEGGKKAALEI